MDQMDRLWALCHHRGLYKTEGGGAESECDGGSRGWRDVGPGAKDAGSF